VQRVLPHFFEQAGTGVLLGIKDHRRFQQRQSNERDVGQPAIGVGTIPFDVLIENAYLSGGRQLTIYAKRGFDQIFADDAIGAQDQLAQSLIGFDELGVMNAVAGAQFGLGCRQDDITLIRTPEIIQPFDKVIDHLAVFQQPRKAAVEGRDLFHRMGGQQPEQNHRIAQHGGKLVGFHPFLQAFIDGRALGRQFLQIAADDMLKGFAAQQLLGGFTIGRRVVDDDFVGVDGIG